MCFWWGRAGGGSASLRRADADGERAGCHTSFPFGRSLPKTSTKQKTPLPARVQDRRRDRISVVVSAILNFRVVDSKYALLNVDINFQFVNTNAQSVLKQVVGRYTYDQLKNEADSVTKSLLARLQPICSVAGVHIQSMQLNELNYAPEIASGMLKKQQAGALIEARKLIVEGAVSIAQDAVRLLEDKGSDSGLKMSNSEKVSLVTNLLTVTCSEGCPGDCAAPLSWTRAQGTNEPVIIVTT